MNKKIIMEQPDPVDELFKSLSRDWKRIHRAGINGTISNQDYYLTKPSGNTGPTLWKSFVPMTHRRRSNERKD